MAVVLHFVPTLDQGGAEKLLVDIVTNDPDNRHVVCKLIEGEHFFDGTLPGRLLGLGMRRQRPILLQLPLVAWRAMAIIRRERPDVVVGWLYYGAVMACLARLFRVRVIWSFHATGFDGLRGFDRLGLAVRILAGLARWRVSHRIHYCSEESRRDHVVLGFPAELAVVVPNGVDTGRFRPQHPESAAAAKPLTGSALNGETIPAQPGNQHCPLIGCVARFDPQKDHATLFAALSILAQRGQSFTCVLAGRGCEPGNTALAELARRYGVADRLLLLGAVAEIEELYRCLDVVVLSAAHGESMPLSLLEGLASGCPIVGTDVGAIRSMLGEHGDVVPPRNPALLADALLRALRLHAGDHQAAIRRHDYVARRFDIQRTTVSWVQAVLMLGWDDFPTPVAAAAPDRPGGPNPP